MADYLVYDADTMDREDAKTVEARWDDSFVDVALSWAEKRYADDDYPESRTIVVINVLDKREVRVEVTARPSVEFSCNPTWIRSNELCVTCPTCDFTFHEEHVGDGCPRCALRGVVSFIRGDNGGLWSTHVLRDWLADAIERGEHLANEGGERGGRR